MKTSNHADKDNYSIVFENERTESMNQLELAQRATELFNEDDSQIGVVCKALKLPRATVYDLLYLHKINPSIKQLFIDGKVGLKPLIDSHKKYGRSIVDVIEKVSDERLHAKRSRKVTFNEIVKALESSGKQPNEASQDEEGTVDPNIGDKQSQHFTLNAPSTKEARQAIHTMLTSIHDCASASQLSSGLFLPESDALLLKRQLSLLEQWLDELNPQEVGQQGDPLDQSVGSYIFENMVDEPTTERDNDWQHSFIAPEDENQDAFYDEQYH